MSINLDQARAIIAGALAHAATAGFKPLCVVVLDAGGHVIAVERQDGASMGRFEVAFGKTHGALSFGVNSRKLGDLAIERPHFVAGVGTAIGGALVPSAGGVIVVDGATPIGAVGISGDTSDNDELAVLAGLEAAGLTGLAS